MSSELAVISNSANTGIAQVGGLGIDFKSKLFQLKPATINLNQPTTQAEGAIKGKLRITESGEQFDSMRVALLVMPVEQRQYYIGEAGSNRSQENLVCFSRDVELDQPDPKSKVPQSMKCSKCPRADWEKWRQNKVKENIPPCDAFYYALFIDTQYKMPLQMYIRSKSKQSFEKGMKEVARLLFKMNQQGLNPNIFDVSFLLKGKAVQGKTVTYQLDLSDFKIITPDERSQFGDVYLNYANRNSKQAAKSAEDEAADQIEETAAEINNVVSPTEDIPDAEIVV